MKLEKSAIQKVNTDRLVVIQKNIDKAGGANRALMRSPERMEEGCKCEAWQTGKEMLKEELFEESLDKVCFAIRNNCDGINGVKEQQNDYSFRFSIFVDLLSTMYFDRSLPILLLAGILNVITCYQ